MILHTPLLAWYDAHRRDLPWRKSGDPYAVWVSEVMLQQTQVATVVPYYERWMKRFPSVDVLAQSDPSDVLSVWQGLGYYRRARSLLEGAKRVVQLGLPASAAEWLKVPGVGPYTAGAIASIALGEPAPLVDGNVERVYARINADDAVGASLTRAAWQWANAAVHPRRPGDWNQALMELGATICRPVSPRCQECPLVDHCSAARLGSQGDLPKTAPKSEVRRLSHFVWVPVYRNQFGIRQIPEGEWWAGMWEFPRSTSEETLADLLPDARLTFAGSFSHSVTHHRIRVQVKAARVEKPIDRLKWVDPGDLSSIAMPAPQRKALGLAMAIASSA